MHLLTNLCEEAGDGPKEEQASDTKASLSDCHAGSFVYLNAIQIRPRQQSSNNKIESGLRPEDSTTDRRTQACTVKLAIMAIM